MYTDNYYFSSSLVVLLNFQLRQFVALDDLNQFTPFIPAYCSDI